MRGRIVLWDGGSLWAFNASRDNTVRRSTDAHSHHAIQLTLAVDGSFVFQIGGELVPGPVVLIAPDIPHSYEPQGRNAIVFIEPESAPGAALLNDLAGRSHMRPDWDASAEVAARLRGVWEAPRLDDAAIASVGCQLVAELAGSGVPAPIIDRRIARVLDLLSAGFETHLDLCDAAGIACLSESRFSHLFVEQVGLPFRTYLLWRRLTLAVNRITEGATLTTAAHDAGFADSAHFSRTFIRMFGVPASFLRLI